MLQDRRVLRVVVLTTPTVTFPFPGEPEINFLARIHDDHIPPQGDHSSNPKWWLGDRIVPVVLGGDADHLPDIGTEVEVREFDDFYRGSGSRQISRLCF